MTTRAAFDRFTDVYRGATAGLPVLALTAGELTAHLRELGEIAGPDGSVEEYAAEVFSDSRIRWALASIDSTQPSPRIRALVNDVVLAAALVPVREEQIRDRSTLGTTSLHQRRAIEAVSAGLAAPVLARMTSAAAATELADDIGYDPAAPLSVRLLRLATLNLAATTRKTLQDREEYQRLEHDPHLPDLLYAATGHDEQRFLSTCVVAAAGTDLRARTPTVIGLVEVGRALVARIRRLVATLPADVLDERESGGVFRPSRTLRELVGHRLDQAELTFLDLERRVRELDPALTGRKLTAALDQLTRRWSRTMQKLAPLTTLEDGVDSLPVLTKKVVDGTWLPNVVSAPLVADRGLRRLAPAGGDGGRSYLTAMSEQFADGVRIVGQDDWQPLSECLASAADPRAWLEAFWRVLVGTGGCAVSTSTHGMWLKPSRRAGRRVFLVSDPKFAGFDVVEPAAFSSFAVGRGLRVPPDLARRASAELVRPPVDASEPIAVPNAQAPDLTGVRVRLRVSW